MAMIRGGVGNDAVGDPGWPRGAAAIFNHPGRVGWWEGPPFGGGQWHAECRGDARAFNAVLADFAKLDAKSRRVVVHDGIGHSFWLNMNREPAKEAGARVDWIFMAWQPANWEHLSKMPAGINPTDPHDAGKGPPTTIDAFAGGNLRWAEVVVPEGIEVVDQRLEAHGFTAADGSVLEGKAIDLATGRPIAARVRLERVESGPKGGSLYSTVAEAAAGPDGRWVLRKAPTGWNRVVVAADGFVPRIAGYSGSDGQPGWHPFDAGLSRASTVAGRVVDDQGRPVADVEVLIQDATSGDGGLYESPGDLACKTDADGRFRSDGVPIGRATIWLRKPEYTRPGLGLPIATPAQGIELKMTKSARVRVTVEFTGTFRLIGYAVQIEPEGGAAVGKYSGSGDIDDQNQVVFNGVPPGRYVLVGRPNPDTGDHRTEPVAIELKGGQEAEVKVLAK